MIESLLQALGMRQKQQQQQPRQPILLQPYNKGKQGSTSDLVSGANRAAWIRYAEEAAANGGEPLPYAQWVKQQQGK